MTPNPMGKEPSMVSTLPPPEWTSVPSSVKSRREVGIRKYWALRGWRNEIENIEVVVIKKTDFPGSLRPETDYWPECFHLPSTPAFLCWEEVSGNCVQGSEVGDHYQGEHKKLEETLERLQWWQGVGWDLLCKLECSAWPRPASRWWSTVWVIQSLGTI